MGSAGVSITITSLTDVFAFLLGTMSQLPALSTFCIFAAIGITADFILQVRPSSLCAGTPCLHTAPAHRACTRLPRLI